MDYKVIALNLVTAAEMEDRIKILVDEQEADLANLRNRLDTQKSSIEALATSSAKKTMDAVAVEAKRIDAIVAALPKPPSISGLAKQGDVDKAIAVATKDLASKDELANIDEQYDAAKTKIANQAEDLSKLQEQVDRLVERVKSLEELQET